MNTISWNWLPSDVPKEILIFAAQAHGIKVDSSRLDQVKYRTKIFSRMESIEITDIKRVERFLGLSYSNLERYLIWIENKSDWNEIQSNPQFYPLPILYLTCKYLNIHVGLIDVAYLRRSLSLFNLELPLLLQGVKIINSIAPKEFLIPQLALPRAYPNVNLMELDFNKFRNQPSSVIESYTDLLIVGWLKHCHIYLNHPLAFFFDPHIEELHYDPQLPESAYTGDEIKELILKLDPKSKNFTYDELNQLHWMKLFKPISSEHYGKLSPFLFESIDEENPGILYGDTPILIKELILHFNANDLTDPWTGKLLHQRQIDSLITQRNLDLNLLLLDFKSKDLSKDDAIEMFFDVYDDILDEIQDVFVNLLETGMVMRGWIGVGPYPIKKTNKKEIDHEFKTILLGQHLEFLYEQLNEYPAVGKLPLVIYRQPSFRLSKRAEDGWSILDRLNIVVERKIPEACTRISSNWFVCSSYYYLSFIGYKHKFNINELELLSD